MKIHQLYRPINDASFGEDELLSLLVGKISQDSQFSYSGQFVTFLDFHSFHIQLGSRDMPGAVPSPGARSGSNPGQPDITLPNLPAEPGSLPEHLPPPHQGWWRAEIIAGEPSPQRQLSKPSDDRVGEDSDAPVSAVIDASVNLATVPADGIGIAYGDTFRLHSLPGSGFKVFLDFDGHTTTGTQWNSYWNSTSIVSPAFSLDGSASFTAAELLAVQRIWQRVAEYFSPFNIDVTTEDPGAAALSYSGGTDVAFGIRVVITDESGKNYGGLGYNGSFDWSNDTPVFVYANPLGDNTKSIADAAAHEVGHSLGLDHDGQGSSQYYWGHGSGATSWAPVMGAGYNSSVVQWSNGGYIGASNTQDDLTIITTQNSGVTFRTDDAGNSFATAAPLSAAISNGVASVSTYGIISGSGALNDIDVFAFNVAAGGSVNLSVVPATQVWVTGSAVPVVTASPFGMLDVKLSLYDAAYNIVAGWDDATRQDGVLRLSGVKGGTYYLAIDGTGWGDPTAATPSGWSEYGSLGQYLIMGTYDVGSAPPPPPPPPAPQLVLDRTHLTTTEAGGSDAVTLRVLNPSGEVAVAVSGLDATEGSLSASTLVLNAANNWTATLGVTGRDDRDVDGSVGYRLSLAAPGFAALAVDVVNQDNDRAPDSLGVPGPATAAGRTQIIGGSSLSALAMDDGTAVRLVEGGASPGYAMEWIWQFSGLAPGEYRLQTDARSTGEAFRIQISTDAGASWRSLGGAPNKAVAWDGSYLATGVDSTLLVRVTDMQRNKDTVQDSVAVDLLTLAPVSVFATAAAEMQDAVLI